MAECPLLSPLQGGKRLPSSMETLRSGCSLQWYCPLTSHGAPVWVETRSVSCCFASCACSMGSDSSCGFFPSSIHWLMMAMAQTRTTRILAIALKVGFGIAIRIKTIMRAITTKYTKVVFCTRSFSGCVFIPSPTKVCAPGGKKLSLLLCVAYSMAFRFSIFFHAVSVYSRLNIGDERKFTGILPIWCFNRPLLY